MDKYLYEKVIGSGTFGKIWLVKSKLSRHAYVLKEINLNSLSEDEQKQALTEAEVLSQLKHGNIIRHQDAWIDRNKFLQIVMEYAEGGDLHSAIRHQNGIFFSERRILTWFIQICLGLQYIHSKSILHRDLKSENIFLTRGKVIKIGDFGIARLLQGPEGLAKTAIGTPYYLSPEIFQRKLYNYKSDIWALGCVLFEMTALEHAFKANDFFQLANSVLNGQRRKLPRNCSPTIKEVVDKLLKIDPKERPSTVEVLENPALQPYLSEYMASQSSSDNFLPFLTGKCEKNVRRSSFGERACKAMHENFIKRRNAVSSISIKAAKRPNPLTKETTKPKLSYSNNQQPESKNCQKPPALIAGKGQKKTSEHKAWHQKHSTKSDNAGSSTFFSSCDTYTIPPTNPELYMQRCKFSNSEESLKRFYDDVYDTTLQGIENVTIDDDTYYVGNSYCTNSTRLASAVDDSIEDASTTLVPDTDDVFNFCETVNDFTNQTFDFSVHSNCTHSQCHKCMLDTLWKNRIRNSVGGSVDTSEYSRLKNKLLRVYKNELFEKLHRFLVFYWDRAESSTSEKKFQDIMNSLNYDQVQSIPLMMQLIQLDHLNKSKD